jgi:transcriptional regulator with XRE-family HTH domain
MASFGDLVRKHRYAQGWTQAELARHIGTNQTQISQWETGREDFANWAITVYFDKLLELFDYPEDLLVWWVERVLTWVEKTTSQAHSYKERASRRGRPTSVLAKLEHLIEQNRTEHAELTALRNELKSLLASGAAS